MITIETIMKATGREKRNILDHLKYIRKHVSNFGIYEGSNILLNTAEFGEYIIFSLDVERLGKLDLALENLIAYRSNVKNQLDILSKVGYNLSEHAPLKEKYFDIPLNLK